jgi:ubiquinone biosynthesis protein UbiJ
MATNNSDWMNKFQEVINSCQVELKKTTQIGMKMLSASQSNAQLHETFEALGHLTREAIRNGELKWESERVNQLLNKIDKLENELENFEFEVRSLKNPSSPDHQESSAEEKNP